MQSGIEILIRNAIAFDYDAIQKIADSLLGAGYFVAGNDGILLVAEQQGAVVGFCYGYRFESASAIKGLGDGVVVPETWRVPPGAMVGVLKTVAVSQDCQHRGVGKLLGAAFVQAINPVSVIFSPAWQQPDGQANAEGLLASLGFVRISRTPDFWKADSIMQGYLCPSCGNPCRCTMLLFGRKGL